MSDNQPRHRKPYEPHEPYPRPESQGSHEPYAAPDPYAQNTPQAPYDPQTPYDPQASYGRPYGQQGPVQGQPHEPYPAQQPHQPQQEPRQQPRTPWPAAGGRHAQYGSGQYGSGQYGYDPAAQQPPARDGYGTPQTPQPHGPQTQTWDAPTWETGTQPPVQAAGAETTHLPTQHQTAPPAEEPYARQHPQRAKPHPQGAAAARPAAPLAPHQRARAEGRSPIIPPGRKPAVLTAALALLLALAAPLGQPALFVPVVLLQAVTAAGWFRLNGMWPARQGIALAFLAGLTTDVALLATDRGDAPVVAVGTLGVWCLFVLVLQLRNRSSADERMYALTAGLASTALAVLASGQLAAAPHAVVVGAVAVGVATLARALPLPPYVSVAVALVAAAGAGVAAGGLTDLGPAGALLGFAAGGCALIGLRVASYDYPSRFVHMTAGVALPLALAAPAVYVLGRALA